MFTGKHKDELGLAWHAAHLVGAEALTLSSPDFTHEGVIPVVHASKRAGGQELSPALAWSPAPDGTAQLLLVVEDPDAPLPQPFVHCVAVIDAGSTGLAQGALDAENPGEGVRVLRSTMGRGWFGPMPPKGHRPHRYVFQLFALATPLTMGSKSGAVDSAPPRKVIAAAAGVLSRGRLDGLFQRPK
jgi:Raf kinase inhibitor-like YbhB/YbcL family protein